MVASAHTSSDPYLRRLWAYVLERFPPVAYTVLVLLFSGSAFGLLRQLTGEQVAFSVAVRAAAVVLLVFFHLRIMDEHKDQEGDRVAYPDRLLTRGVVTLPMLAKVGWVAVVLEGVIALSISPLASFVWVCTLGFTLLMKVEFGLGSWLSKHLIVYAVTHNPIVAMLAMFLWSTMDAPWPAEYGLYVAIVSLGSLAFEVGRKVRLPEEEIAGVESYSSVLGRRRADNLLIAIRWITGILLAGLAVHLGQSLIAAIALTLSVATHVLLSTHTRKAKSVEGVATVMLLVDFLLIWGLAW